MTTWPVIGREGALGRLLDALGGRGDNSVVAIRGSSGIGKTRVMAEAVDRLARAGAAVLEVVGSSAAAEIPFGAVAHLLPDDVSGKDHLAVLRGALRTLGSAASADGVTTCVLAVDDAQWLDSASAAVVHRATTVDGLRLVMTVREGVRPPDVIARLAVHPATVAIELEALTDVQIGALLDEVLGAPVVRSSVLRFARLSEGNPLWLRELVRGARRRGALTRHGGLWRLDGSPVDGGSLYEAVRATMADLPADAHAVIAAVALADVVGVRVLERTFDHGVLAAVDAQGLLAAVPDRRRAQLRLSHPLYGEVATADLPPLRARQLRLRLADVIEAAGARRRRDLLRVARWRLDAGDRTRPDLLTAAAHAAGGVQAHDLAGRFARAAVEAGGGFAALIALGEALQRRGANTEAEAELRRAATAATTSEERVRAHALRADVLFCTQRFADAEQALRDAEATADTESSRQRIAVQRALFAASTGDLARAARLAEAALAEPSITPRTRADAAYVVSQSAPPCGRPGWAVDVIDRAGADVAGRSELDYAYAGDVLLPARALACWWAWRFDEVETASQAVSVSLPDSDEAAVWITWVEGLVALARGRVRRAGRSFAIATTQVAHVYPDPAALGDLRAGLWSTRAEAAALAGDRATAERALSTAEQEWPAEMLVPYRVTARVWTAAARGDIATARRHAIDGAAQAHDVGAHLLEARLWHDLVRLGGADRAAAGLERLVHVVEAPQAGLYAAHARGVTDGDADAVRRAADGFAAAGVVLLAAEARAQLAALLRTQGRATAAAGADLAARRLIDRCDGARTPALAEMAAPDLTARELEIALLAARGLSDRDIAGQLGISPRTVGSHLYRCYAKLGIHRRGQLVDLLG